MKKTYTEPAINVIEFDNDQPLLSASLEYGGSNKDGGSAQSLKFLDDED